MSTKRTPVNFRTYYKLFMEQQCAKRNALIVNNNRLAFTIDIEKRKIIKDLKLYEEKYNIKLEEYKEFVDAVYIDGTLGKLAKGIYYNSKEDYIVTAETLLIYNFANLLEEKHDCEIELNKSNKLCQLTLKEYTEILKVYYFKVHEMMILDGCGYKMDNGLGWLCINRCKKENARRVLNFKATKEKEKEILANGGRIYNKEEAEWCKANGIEYNYTDKRVYLDLDYVYEVAWIKPVIKNASKFKFEIADYRSRELRGLDNEQIKEKANNDLKVICNYPLDIKTKLMMCISINKKLYFKFIRNETQKSIAYKQIDR